ncbi:phytanoyl-CoA dioxygenase family protein [Fimbriimonas ginsengisoli]|uniref:Phytanoyl-CoA dioxygenase n=1 Tax=Fimbriimonas ginsengisoli Gsoil 348 TaxID=661478 RepID=A0A068NUN8_FIMGI|nr:phytanoyl-CoA dioxygenase family protein [Fimbriimonas ginsengisoli]AIE85334.1 Phytanoyl-CoA dioxygenase [Fimbriimonas ginsengisoli Gsoil 348]
MTTYTKPHLTPDEVRHYEKDGYVLHNRPVFEESEFARLKSIFEEDLEKYGVDGLDVIHFKDPRLLEFLLSDTILDLVEPVVGPNIGLWSSHFISKPPKVGKATPWHEDSSYWNGRVSTMAGICTVWLAVDRTNPENGSMAVIPGTHSNGFSQYKPVDSAGNIFSSEIVEVDESKAVYFTLEPNECSLHEGRIIHGAKANTSDYRRAGYTMRYFPTTSRVFPERNQGHKIWLARGIDMAGNTYENA